MVRRSEGDQNGLFGLSEDWRPENETKGDRTLPHGSWRVVYPESSVQERKSPRRNRERLNREWGPSRLVKRDRMKEVSVTVVDFKRTSTELSTQITGRKRCLNSRSFHQGLSRTSIDLNTSDVDMNRVSSSS